MVLVIELPGHGKIRVCADDIGCSLARLSVLLLVYPIFCAIRGAAGPHLKPNKCILIPTGSKCTPQL
eukprot:14712761-Heterocapsa_arctica.AAC.1